MEFMLELRLPLALDSDNQSQSWMISCSFCTISCRLSNAELAVIASVVSHVDVPWVLV